MAKIVLQRGKEKKYKTFIPMFFRMKSERK